MRSFALPALVPSQRIKEASLFNQPGVAMARYLAIHIAVSRGDVRGATTCLRDNPSIYPDVLDLDEKTALYIACLHGHSSVARVLLKAGADVNLRCGPGNRTPLHAAAFSEHWGMLRQLVEADVDLSMRTMRGLAVHHLAVLSSSLAGLSELVELAVDFDVQDHDGSTALVVCAGGYTNEIQNAREKAQILLDGGARWDIVSH